MEKIKIRLSKTNIVKEILGIISQKEIPRKIIFSCQGNIPLLADNQVLKKIKETAHKHQKEIEFISSQKFVRDILKNANFTTYSACPVDYKNLEENVLEEIYLQKTLPPKNKPQTENFAGISSKKEKISEEKLENSFKKHKIHNPGRKKTSRSLVFFIAIFILFLLGGVLIWITPKATITVKPTISPIPVIQNIIIKLPDAKLEEDDKELPQINGVFIGTTVSSTENYASSGRKYDITNAHGKVTLYNESNKPKFLIPSRLSTEDGLIFRFKNKVTIPAKKNGKAGKKVVEIFADNFDKNGNPIGYRGNIIAGTELFFPALRPELHSLYYAKADKGPLTGGSTLTHYLVSPEDKEKSREFLKEILQGRAIDKLKKENKARSLREKKNYVLLEDKNLLVKIFGDFKFPEDLIGQELQTFEVSGKMELSGIVFDQENIEKIILKKLSEIIDDRQQLIEIDKKSIKYNLLDEKNFAENKYIKISVKAVGIKSLDFTINTKDAIEWRNKIKKQIAGKTKKEARSILINIPEIEQVSDIKISPFWSDRLPELLERIKFKTNKVL